MKLMTDKWTGVLNFLVFLPLMVAAFHSQSTFSRPRIPLRVGLDSIGDGKWLNHGLLISSFSDGLKSNPEAIDFLMHGLVKSLWRERQVLAESEVQGSSVQSPCCGPNLDAFTNMEMVDAAIADLDANSVRWQESLDFLAQNVTREEQLELRFLYIPTAMYAFRRDSQTSPGKQRQRARADGKKRRNEIVELLASHLGENIIIRTITLDFHDGSIKQPEGSDDTSKFPTNGKEAFQNWRPHFVYVQGGNTFWLHHCIEEGNWGPDIVQACTGEDAAVYCGTSAGAIVMGTSVSPACWKGWDDPSVVPGCENYSDWGRVSGFGLVGRASFFPHMDEQWQRLIDSKTSEMGSEGVNLYCLRDEDVCYVNGRQRKVGILASCASLTQ